jgi:hypothetical protein
VPPLAATVSGLADVSQQPYRRHRSGRPFRPANNRFPDSLLSHCHTARPSALDIVWRNGKSNRGVDLSPDHRGIPVGPGTSIPHQGPGRVVRASLRAASACHGHSGRPIAPRSPWQNTYVERHIGSIRQECLDHMIAFGEAHLRRIVGAYAAYYNEARTHRSLNKDAPLRRSLERLGAITSQPVLGGLHHRYCRI